MKFYGENMSYQSTLNEYLQVIVGKKLEKLNLACEMMMFSFEEYAFHTLGLTRIIKDNDILVTTLDYQNWDGEVNENNDEWYFANKYRDEIEGGVVTAVSVSPLYDVEIIMNNGVKIELFVKNGYHHFDDENEQWVFFRHDDHEHPFISVWSKSVDIATN